MKKQFSALALLMLVCLSLSAQTGNIKGRVLDSNKLSLPGATIFTGDLQYGTITDVNGNYVMTGIPAGDYTLKVSYIGFNAVEQKVTVSAGHTTPIDFNMVPGIGIQEVTINGGLQGQSKALNQQKTNANITNVIASDQVGKFPDANIGDALKRIPGINVQYDQGEARFGNIRGTAPQYNSITINGERIPSAEAENRTIQLDLIPSDMIQTIEVSKALTPDMDGDAIGASVNLVTLSEPAGERISGGFSGGYNFLAEKMNYSANLIYGNRFAQDKIGMTLSASINDNQLGSDNVEAEWSGDDNNYYLSELQVRQYYLERLRMSYSGAFDFKINENHTLYLRGMYNRRKDWENRYRNVFKPEEEPDSNGDYINDDNAVEKETKAGANNKDGRLEDQQMMQFSLNGDHIFGKAKMDWGLSFSKASEDRPQERYLTMVIEGEDMQSDISNPKKPYMEITDSSLRDLSTDWEVDEMSEENQYTEDIDVVAKLNIEIPLAQGAFKNSLKFGGKYKSKSKERDNEWFEVSASDAYESTFLSNVYSHTKDWSKDDFLPGDKYDVGSFVTKEYLGGLDFTDSDNFEMEADYSEYAGNFEASETVSAAYIMLDQKLGNKLSAIVGLRLENTFTEGEGKIWDDDEEVLSDSEKEKSSYTNILPNLQLKYDISDNSIVRFAFTSTMARPNYYDLVPYQEIEDGTEISLGNADLEPTTSNNIDLMVEHYFKSIGILSGGFFYKDIKDFIVDEIHEDYTYNGTTWDKYTQPINGGDASLWGLEFAAQRQLDFLPGFLKGLGIYANYTYTHSKITNFNIEDRDGEDLAMPGSPESTLNLSLSYNTNKFSGRLSFNYASDFIEEFGGEAFEDVYYDEVTYLDLNLTYNVNKNYLVFADLNNILNQPLRYFQGQSNRTYQMEYYDMTAKVGVKINF
jgi:TonB-dependent receptor